MSRAPSRLLFAFAACAGLALSVTTAAAQPQTQPAGGNNPPDAAKQDDSKNQDRAAFRERMRDRGVRLLAELREDQTKLEEAIKQFDAGKSFDDIRSLLPDRLVTRFRMSADGPADADGGPRRGGGQNANQPFNDEDWEAVNAIIKHAQPDMLEKFNELRQKDPEQAQKSMLAAYPRLRWLLDLYKHDRSAFDLRLEELVIFRSSLPLAKEVVELKKAGKAEDSEEVKAAREKLRDLGKRHYQNRLAIQRHELEGLRQRVQKRERDIEEQAASPDRFIERSIDGLVKLAERGGFNRDPSERRGSGPPNDGPRRRPNDDN